MILFDEKKTKKKIKLMCNLDVILKIPLPPLLIITTKKKDLDDKISKKIFSVFHVF